MPADPLALRTARGAVLHHAINDRVRRRGKRRPPLFALWEGAIAAMRRPEFELTCEEFSTLDSLFLRLQQIGVTFDPAFEAMMNVLRAQLINSDADSDQDAHDKSLDLDDDDAMWAV